MHSLAPGIEPIPGYQLVRFLGKGQFGEVWETTAPGGGAAALKFLDLNGKQGWKEFRGIQRVKKLRHANLMPITALWLLDIHGAILDEDQVRTVMDGHDPTQTVVPSRSDDRQPRWLVVANLLGDATLSDELDAAKKQGMPGIPVEKLLVYLSEAAKGIDYLNSSHCDLGDGVFAVQHCDIKPDNILLLGGSALVCDFGVAQVLRSAEQDVRTTGMVGSPAYMPPECAHGAPSATSDQYSLAVSYYELRTGELPFAEQTQAAVFDAHRSGTLDLDRVPKAEQTVLRRATAVDPKRRFKDCRDLVAALEAATLQPSSISMSPSRRFAAAGLLGVLVACAPLVWWSFWGARTATFTLRVDPSASTVAIDGVGHDVASDGTVEFESDASRHVGIEVSNGPNYETWSQDVDLRSYVVDKVIEITLPRSDRHFVSLAMEHLSAGEFSDAVDVYATAITKKSSNAQFPRATLLRGLTIGDKLAPLRCSGDGQWLIAIGKSSTDPPKKQINLWKISDRVETFAATTLPIDSDIARWSVGDSWIVVTGNRKVTVIPLDDPTLQRESTLPLEAFAVGMSSEDRLAIIGNSDGQVNALDFSLPEPSTTKLGAHSDTVEMVECPPGSKFVFTASFDDSLRVWSVDNDQPEVRVETPDGISAMSSIQHQVVFAEPDTIRMWSDTTEQFTPIPLEHTAPFVTLKLHPLGHLLAAGCDDGSVCAGEFKSGAWSEIRLPSSHVGGAVNGLAFDPGSDFLVSISDDSTVVLWDLRSERLRSAVILQAESIPVGVCISRDGRWLFCEQANGNVLVWDFAHLKLIKRACDKTSTKPMPAESNRHLVDA